MLAEQPIPAELTDVYVSQGDPSPATLLRNRKPGWLISLIHYFAFGVDAYLLETIAQRAAVAGNPVSANLILLPVESIEIGQPENPAGLSLRKPTLTHKKPERRQLAISELNITNG